MGEQAQLVVDWRGRERYAVTWEHQLALHAQRVAGAAPDTLVLVEHEPVVTLGRHGDQANLVAGEELLAARGIDFHRVERGGDITYHGPGQLVGYPILSLRARDLSVRDLMRGLEECLIRTLQEYGVTTGRIEGLTGVWWRREDGAAADTKLAALGVAVKQGVSYHGFAFNVDPDLSHYQLIVPCGIVGKPVGALSQVLGRPVSLDDVRPRVERHFREVFEY